ncbi:MAG: ABC transporter ATP-binding protein [Thermodesulfobacteriota bacterium]|nr:ABC transporter ATP-binding protein [Thermodesulfobacteriota bacterium]
MILLEIKDLHVSAGGKEILKGINLSIEEGRTAVIFGPNGSGKSTLMGAVAGLPGYKIDSGQILFRGEDITGMGVDERAKKGIGMSFQHPPSIKGVRLQTMLDVLSDDSDTIAEYAEILRMKPYMERDINVGFSGGERKRSEILQLMVQQPSLLLLDEPESGVDIENIAVIADGLKILLEKNRHINERKRSGFIITHTGLILNYIRADIAYVFMDGHILGSGSPPEIFEEISNKGYSECVQCFNEKFGEEI